MYLLNKELVVNWTLYSQVAPPLLSDLSIVEHTPDGNVGENLPVIEDNYSLPGTTKLGFIAHKFTPTVKGLWQIRLYISGTLISTQKVIVSENDTDIKKFIST